MNRLALILPCFNPIGDWHLNVEQSIDQIRKRVPAIQVEVYLVNDGSTSKTTAQGIEYLSDQIDGFRVCHLTQNKGKGFVVRKGMTLASADFYLFTDIDFPYSTDSFIRILEAVQNGSDVAIGTRGDSYYDSIPSFRRKLSKYFQSAIRLFFQLPTSDTQGGLKGFNEKGRALFLQTTINRYLFDLEFVHLIAKTKNVNFTTVPVELRPDVSVSSLPLSVLMGEGFSFMKIFFKSKF